MDKSHLQLEIQKLISVNKSICNEIMEIGELKDLELIQEKLGETIEQLTFWFEQNNEERFFYELKQYLQWVLKEFQ
jgi:hypothetical protein